MEYRGQIAIASIFDAVDDAYYKYKALIETGNLSKKECYVAYRGDPDKLKGNVVVRFELPFKEASGLSLDGAITSNFVTSTVPNGFEFASSSEVILHGIWEERMKNGFAVPIISKINNYYDIGIVQSALYYAYKSGEIVSYRLHKSAFDILQYGHRGDNVRIGNALQKYLRRINNLREKDTIPRVVILDKKISLDEIILTELNKTGLMSIEMEPQQ